MSADPLLGELLRARWFGGKSRGVRSARVIDQAQWVDSASLQLVELTYDHGPPETYVLAERFDEPQLARALLERFQGATVSTERGARLVFEPTYVLTSIERDRTEPITLLRGEQSNSSLRFGDALILKLFRRVQFGPQPDVEIGRFLTEHSRFGATPAVAGSLEYTTHDGHTAALALLQRFVPNRGDAWRTTLMRLNAILDTGGDLEQSVDAMARLGETTAALHVALAHADGEPAFEPEPIQASDIAGWRDAIAEEVQRAAQALRQHQVNVDEQSLLQRADGVASLAGCSKIRHHGDYHLGQVLEADDGAFIIIDFEGEPARPLAQRREKHTPLRDVAGMLRSFDYARNAALRAGDPTEQHRHERAAEWYTLVRQAFLERYLHTVRTDAPQLLPADVSLALAALELDKAAYEVLYELNNRPDWLPIPLAALQP